MIIPVNKLPSNFKPYPFKSFKMRAISVKQALALGSKPSVSDITNLIQELTDGEIDAKLLVPIDVKYLLAMLAFHAYPKQSWTLPLVCPECGKEHTRTVTMADFPPIPSLTDDDPYPLVIDDGKHVYELGYATAEAVGDLNKASVEYIDLIAAHTIAIDNSKDNIREKLLEIDDFGILSTMVQAIQKFFKEETYSEFKCPECGKLYKVAMSAVEVTQYTPFHDPETAGRYKTNFRL